jgi:hypothetical protein
MGLIDDLGPYCTVGSQNPVSRSEAVWSRSEASAALTALANWTFQSAGPRSSSRTASSSIDIRTSLPTRTAPASSAWFQVNPKSRRSMTVSPLKPGWGSQARVADGKAEVVIAELES